VFAINTKPQDMDRGARPLARQLNPGDEPHTAGMPRMISCCGLVTCHRVMIGYSQKIDLASHRARHQLAGIQGAIRGEGVCVEVNQHSLYTGQRDRISTRIV
jgi:hypothetical protein